MAQPQIFGHYVNSKEHGKNQKSKMSDVSFKKLKGGAIRMTVHKGKGRKYTLKKTGKYTIIVDGKRRKISAKWDSKKLETVETRYSKRGKPTSADHSTWTVEDGGKKLIRKIVIPPYTKANGEKVVAPYEATAVYFRQGGPTSVVGNDTPVTKPVATKTPKKPEDEKPPAELVVSGERASPNTHTGVVIFTAQVENTGGSVANNIKASFKVVGPDGKTWVKKNLYHGPMKPGDVWKISEKYKHRSGGVAVTDQEGRSYVITIKPTFK